MKRLLRTEHVEIFQRADADIYDKYAYQLFLMDDDGRVRGGIEFVSLESACRAAAEYIRRLDKWR